MRITTYRTEMDKENHNILVKESTISYGPDDSQKSFDKPNDIYKLMCSCFHLDHMAEEYIYMIGLDAKCHMLGVFNISHGTATGSYFSPREIFIRALLCGAVHIVIVHNHPSGDPSPSKEDLCAAERIKESGKLIGINVTDNIIIGNGSFYSFAAQDISYVGNTGQKQDTAQTERRQRGHWIEEDGIVICSECGEEHEWDTYRANYCDCCGAKMEER